MFMKIVKIEFDHLIDHDLLCYYGINPFGEPLISIKSKITLNVEYCKSLGLGIYLRPKS